MKSYIIGLLTTTFFVLFSSAVLAQEKQYKVACVGFYNLENLFDTVSQINTSVSSFEKKLIDKTLPKILQIKQCFWIHSENLSCIVGGRNLFNLILIRLNI